jgi:N6-L-threonylcarbamoyladenine synthase
MLTLGIETSCDDTGVALVEDGQVLSNVVASQYQVHAPYGGVVPELAARAHLDNLPLVLDAALSEAGRTLEQVDLFAATTGPGLQIALLVGVAEAKGLATATGKPFVAVNHLRAHVHAARMANLELEPPFLALLVSGGHTSLVRLDEAGDVHELGRTRDDAAGECFDKVARVLGLPGAGGPAIQKAAAGGDRRKLTLPRGHVKGAPMDFSFSGLKTAAVRTWEKGEYELADFCASFQEAIVAALGKRVEKALKKHPGASLTAAGGVAANSRLRERLEELADANGARFFPTPLKLCTDNAAMIAGLAEQEYRSRGASPLATPTQPGLGFRLPG